MESNWGIGGLKNVVLIFWVLILLQVRSSTILSYNYRVPYRLKRSGAYFSPERNVSSNRIDWYTLLSCRHTLNPFKHPLIPGNSLREYLYFYFFWMVSRILSEWAREVSMVGSIEENWYLGQCDCMQGTASLSKKFTLGVHRQGLTCRFQLVH